MQTKEQFLALLREHKLELQSLGVKRCGLFGSFARNQVRAESDIDVLVEFQPGRKTFDNFMNLAFLMEDWSGRRVDLMTPEALSPFIGPHILREVEYASLDA